MKPIDAVARLALGGLLTVTLATPARAALAPEQSGTGAIEGRLSGGTPPKPIQGAFITVTELRRKTQSDGEGHYRLTGIPAGVYEVQVNAIGWTPKTVAVTVPDGGRTDLDINLASLPVVLADVVVSASRERQSRAEASVSISVVDQAELGRALPHHPADVMSRVPGAWVANLSGEGHMTAIRQPITTKPVYAYLEDGVPIRSTGFFNHNALYEINLPQADRVEVIKGPGTALHGSDAIGGVVSSFTRGPSERSQVDFFVEGGRFGYARALVSGSGTWGTDGVRADLNLTRSDSYRDQAPYSRQSGTLRWDHGRSGAQLKTLVAVSHIDQPGDGGGDVSQAEFDERPNVNSSPVAYRRVLAVRAASTLERRGELSLFTATLYGRYNELDLLPSWQLSFDPQTWASSNSSVGALTRYRRTVLPLRSNVSAGVDVELSPGRRLEQQIITQRVNGIFNSYTTGETQYDYNVTFWQASPFAQVETTPWDRLRLDFGLRFDWVGFNYDNKLTPLATGAHRRPASTDVSYLRLSPKIGATLELAPGLHAFASYRAAFRAPAESQLFRQGAAVNTVDLAPVKADNYEAGLRAAIGRRLSVEGTAYELDIRDDILTLFDPGTGLRIASNAGATRHRGVELGFSSRPVDAIRVDASWAFTKQTYIDWKPNPTLDYSGKEIELAPRDMGRFGVTITPRFLETGFLAAEVVRLGRYWMDPENTVRYGGFNLVNLSASVPAFRGLDLVGRLQNLGNERYAETSSYTALQGRRYRPGPPRSFFLGAQYHLGYRAGNR